MHIGTRVRICFESPHSSHTTSQRLPLRAEMQNFIISFLTFCSYLVLKRVQGLWGEANFPRSGAEGYELSYHTLLVLSIQNAQLHHCRKEKGTGKNSVHLLQLSLRKVKTIFDFFSPYLFSTHKCQALLQAWEYSSEQHREESLSPRSWLLETENKKGKSVVG